MDQISKSHNRKLLHQWAKLFNVKVKDTADFAKDNGKEGLSSHIYVSDDNQHLIESTASKPNPKTWPIPEPGNKENHRVVNKPLKNDKSAKKSLRRRRAK